MRKIYLVLLAVALLIAIPAVVLATAPGVDGEAEAEPPTDIEATFTFHDTGTDLIITGTAEGMEPGHQYISLIYDTGSLVEGINACEPSDDSLTDPVDRMFVGAWDVSGDGTGVLIDPGTIATATPSGVGPVVLGPGALYVALSEIGTISVRGGDGGPFGGPPVILCGEVESDDD